MESESIPPLPQHPKPKSKGKKPATPKLKAGPTIKPLDVFKVALNGDAGADSSKNQNLGFEELLSELKGSELNKLDKLVQKRAKRVFKNPEENLKHQRTCEKIAEAISKRRELSLNSEIALKQSVQKKIDALLISSEHSPQGQLQLFLNGKKITLKKLILEHFSEELDLTSSLIKSGTLLQDNKKQSAYSFLRGILQSILAPL